MAHSGDHLSLVGLEFTYIYTPLPWQQAGYRWVYSQYMHDFLMGSQTLVGFTDNRQVRGYMHESIIGCLITMDNGV